MKAYRWMRWAMMSVAVAAVVAVVTPAVTAQEAAVADKAVSLEYGEIVTTTTAEQLAAFMKGEGYSVEVDPDGDLAWKLDGYKSVIFVADDNASLLFYAAFNDGNATLEKVNNWNKTRKYSRSYIDNDGDPCLELDLDLVGGVTPDRIRDYLRTCRDSFSAWRNEVIN